MFLAFIVMLLSVSVRIEWLMRSSFVKIFQNVNSLELNFTPWIFYQSTSIVMYAFLVWFGLVEFFLSRNFALTSDNIVDGFMWRREEKSFEVCLSDISFFFSLISSRQKFRSGFCMCFLHCCFPSFSWRCEYFHWQLSNFYHSHINDVALICFIALNFSHEIVKSLNRKSS